MRKSVQFTLAASMLCMASAASAAGKISIVDYCDPNDPAWGPTGGCLLKEGDVTFAEFSALLHSVLSAAVVGHPGWRFQPSFTELRPDESLRVTNDGGRTHTLTEVANFGGGKVPPLNEGLTPAPECAGSTDIPAGGRLELRGLGSGDHLFQCCIHPWMRALVKVEDD
jgi:plastocyanin